MEWSYCCDGLKIKRHITGIELLTDPVKLNAGDVNLTEQSHL